MKTKEALDMAKQAGLDLVEISPNARPPVCRIIDYGKFAYEQSKKEKSNKKAKSSSTKLKEVKFRVRIEEHDYVTKLRRAEVFLDHGNKLKVTLMFRGRELEHPELGFEIVNRAVEDLNHIAKPDSDPRRVGRNITLTLSPLPANKKRRRWVTEDEHEPDLEDEDEDDEHDEHDDEHPEASDEDETEA